MWCEFVLQLKNPEHLIKPKLLYEVCKNTCPIFAQKGDTVSLFQGYLL